MKPTTLFLMLFCVLQSMSAQKLSYTLQENISYYPAKQQTDPYIKERCVLDLYYPQETDGFATVVWFHGGGLTEGEKEIPEALKEQGFAVVGVNYRLSPKVAAAEAIKDAAAAVAWTFKNIASFGGDPSKIVVSGHSAGGYLSSMIGLDKSYLNRYDIDADRIAGLVPFSGHAITHFTIRDEQGIPGTQAVVDSLAPLYHVRKEAPEFLLITGDREKELLGRYEENAYFMRMMKLAGHQKIQLYEMDGYDHGMTYPAFPLLVKFVKQRS